MVWFVVMFMLLFAREAWWLSEYDRTVCAGWISGVPRVDVWDLSCVALVSTHDAW